jgi:hypothetical protein
LFRSPGSHFSVKLQPGMRGICGGEQAPGTHRWLFLEHADSVLAFLGLLSLKLSARDLYQIREWCVVLERILRQMGSCDDINKCGRGHGAQHIYTAPPA